MARRCPDAVAPRQATLADHDWLINERGVATVEPFNGSRVHGVVWDVSDHDLATLDSAEGVPVRYRRDRMTVETAAGPTSAWVYIDHRVEPGAPRPGYLERIIDGALHHGLPARWVEFLRRWDPAHWPRQLGPATAHAPKSLTALLAQPGVYETSTLRSRFGFMAIHGGGLERMTEVIAERAADAAGASVYCVHHPDHYPDHLASALYRPAESERLREFLDHVDTVISVHGYGRIGRSTHLLVGGSNRRLAAHLSAHVDVPGYQLITELDQIPGGLRGLHADNPVNLPGDGGVQLELSPRVRGISPRSAMPGDDGLSPATSALIHGLAAAARTWE
ncbi:poly-gamma-glutamate hydrolase family protein [Mycobacterium sp. MS1601]|uniref:poly-gamma-glutamate hydrolase family protein n=1 Tax=Mycobacterium sp. MS1601 TaxID=1936029 RepID=UPI001F1F26DB|nr:poly-gamma-glutamate hydrolase family protein [Mycobacterium sp. MS1601]